MKKHLLILFAIIGLGSSQLNAQTDQTFAETTDKLWTNADNWTGDGNVTGSIATIMTNVDIDGNQSVGQVFFSGTVIKTVSATNAGGILTLTGTANGANTTDVINNNSNRLSTFSCNVTVDISGKTFRNRGSTSAQVVFSNGFTVALGNNTLIIENTTAAARPMTFNGSVTGTGLIDLISVGSNGGILLGSTATMVGYTGNYSSLNNPITSDATDVFLNAGATLTLDGTATLTVNGANTIEGGITRSATTAGAAEVTFNANQTNMANLTVDTQALALDFGGATDVRFSGYTTSTTEGVVDLINYTSGELKIGTTATSVPSGALATWTLDGAPATLTQDADGYITFGACTVDVVTTPIASAGAEYIDLSWVDPTCFDEVLVVAKEGSAVTFTTPTGDGSLYTANAAFGTGGTDANITASEFAVFKGAANNVIVSGLTKGGTTYHFAVFTRKGTNWSAGVTASATTNNTYTSITGGKPDGLLWEDTSSWIGGAVPSQTSDDVIINVGLIINSDLVLGDLVNNSRVTVNSGFSLDVQDLTLVSNNLMILKATSSSFASLIVNTLSSATTGLMYDRFIANTPTNDLVSSPVSGMTMDGFYQNSVNENVLLINTDGIEYAVGPFNNASGLYETYTAESSNGAGDNDNDVEFLSGKGYRMATKIGETGTVRFQGAVPMGNLGIALTDESGTNAASGKWNLIGNPYPSYIDFTTFFNTNKAQFDAGVFQAVYGYNGAASGDKWEEYNLLNLPPDGKIVPGQGFFVASKTGGSTTDVSFTTGMRTTGTDDDFITGKAVGKTVNNIAFAKLNLSIASDTYSTDIYFVDNQTRGVDPGYDAGAYLGNAAGIFTHLVEDNTGIDMAIQALPYNDFNDVVVPLGVKSAGGVQLTISLDVASASVPSGVNVYLEDNITNTWTLLNTGDYVFTPSAELSGTGRFFVHFSSVALSTEETMLNGLQIYSIQDSKTIVVRGQLADDTMATIYDIQGRMVLQQELDNSNTSNTINVNTLNTGIYIFQVENNSQSRTQKVIIN